MFSFRLNPYNVAKLCTLCNEPSRYRSSISTEIKTSFNVGHSMKEHPVLPKDVRAVILISAARLGSGTAQIVVRRLAVRQARVRIPARHPREALY
jgi:hypothetical protein